MSHSRDDPIQKEVAKNLAERLRPRLYRVIYYLEFLFTSNSKESSISTLLTSFRSSTAIRKAALESAVMMQFRIKASSSRKRTCSPTPDPALEAAKFLIHPTERSSPATGSPQLSPHIEYSGGGAACQKRSVLHRSPLRGKQCPQVVVPDAKQKNERTIPMAEPPLYNNNISGSKTKQTARRVETENSSRYSFRSLRPTPATLWTAAAIAGWYIGGNYTIISAKILLSDWGVPPLLLTLQQLVASALVLHLVLAFQDKKEPWPSWQQHIISKRDRIQQRNGKKDIRNTSNGEHFYYFLLLGLFNCMDYLATNAGFSGSAASFVEILKSSEPLSTATVALLCGIDRLNRDEAIGLTVLIMGVILSTWGTSMQADQDQNLDHLSMLSEPKEVVDDERTTITEETIRTALAVLAANISFALRAMSQKLYFASSKGSIDGDQTGYETRRISPPPPLNGNNLLYRMLQIGAAGLFFPTLLFHWDSVLFAVLAPFQVQMGYLWVLSTNVLAFVVKK